MLITARDYHENIFEKNKCLKCLQDFLDEEYCFDQEMCYNCKYRQDQEHYK